MPCNHHLLRFPIHALRSDAVLGRTDLTTHSALAWQARCERGQTGHVCGMALRTFPRMTSLQRAGTRVHLLLHGSTLNPYSPYLPVFIHALRTHFALRTPLSHPPRHHGTAATSCFAGRACCISPQHTTPPHAWDIVADEHVHLSMTRGLLTKWAGVATNCPVPTTAT